MSKIKQMDKILANKIAAGEVVERCSSVVKELVENSIDASSSEIKIELIESGTQEIKVVDDGVGMDKEDALLAFNRHATSKIKNEDDLFHITTLGFRGEALASIASVSKVNLETCDGKEGTEVIIEGGEVISVKEGIARKGTKIVIKDLFYNVPARLKHLKSLYTELSSITDYVNKIALSHPNIKFVLKNNDSVLLNTDGSGNLLKVIKSIYGIETVKKMVEINASNDDYDISGYISLPEVHRSSRNTLITLVNGRVVRNQELNRIINDAYHSYKPDNRYPIVILNIDVDPTLVDVNIHPTKMDVKFSKMEELLDLVTHTIKDKIKENVLIPHIEVENNYVINSFESETEEVKEVKVPIYQEQKLNFDNLDDRVVMEKEESYENKKFPELSYVGVVHGTYIICQDDSGMYLIDQHAAKERVNYEFYKAKFGSPNLEIEQLLFPITIELPVNEYIILRENFEFLKDLGFNIEEFGINSVIIKSHPTWIDKDASEEIIRKLIDLLISFEGKFDLEKFNESAATMLSCKKAIKANEYVSEEEIVRLIDDLKKCNNPYNCPHGRPTIVFYSNYDLEKMFKRTGFENYTFNS